MFTKAYIAHVSWIVCVISGVLWFFVAGNNVSGDVGLSVASGFFLFIAGVSLGSALACTGLAETEQEEEQRAMSEQKSES